jgi:hypothetical protein
LRRGTQCGIIQAWGKLVAKLEYTFKTDTLFKTLFVKHPNLLKQLVCELIGIQLESIGEFVITNPEMLPESLGDKFCRLVFCNIQMSKLWFM